MQQVQLHDKTFSLYISEDQIQARLKALAEELNDEYAGKRLLLVVVLKGAFMVAADLARYLSMQPEISFVRVSSYEDKMASSGKVRSMMGLDEDLTDRHVLIIEDIVDTGYTTTYLLGEFGKQQPASLRLFSLLFKPENLQLGKAPDYSAFVIASDFVVGYGLDYAQLGRELRGIYCLEEGEGK